MDETIDIFLNLSAELTGFELIDLLGTGLAFSYYDIVCERTGEDNCDTLWKAWRTILETSDDVEKDVRIDIMSDPKFGPMARNIIQLWYLGQWVAMPPHWRSVYGNHLSDKDEIISGETYKEGLVWPAIGAHPMGAKQPGYGSWSGPPPPPKT